MNEIRDTRIPKNSLRKQEQRRRRVWLFGGLLLLLLPLLAYGGLRWLTTAPVRNTSSSVTVEIPKGANLMEIGNLLERRGVVRSGWAFALQARLSGKGQKVQAGHYTFVGSMSAERVAMELAAGPQPPVDTRIRLTIPEGYTIPQIAELLQAKGVTDGAAFQKLAKEPMEFGALRTDFELPKRSLEGYLFPDTYFFKPKTSPAQVAETMLMNFSRRCIRPNQQVLGDSRRLHRLVTLASLIEREAKAPQDRARIAGVLENRLRKGMLLQVDATVLYALGQHKERVLYKDLKVASPYNTYLHKGLPPGPIASPGLAALQAALKPEKHAYLYYVARPDGTHLFTKTPEQHQQAIRQAQRERKALQQRTAVGG